MYFGVLAEIIQEIDITSEDITRISVLFIEYGIFQNMRERAVAPR